MSTRAGWESAFANADPCHFPHLVFDHVASPAYETFSSVLSVPKAEEYYSDTEELNRDDWYKFAFALLLKTYVRTNGTSCGLLTSSQSINGNGPKQEAHFLMVDWDESATLLNNSQKLTTIPLTGPDGVIIGRDFDEFESERGFKQFNATLCLTHNGWQTHAPPNVFNSELVFTVENSESEAKSDEIKVTLYYSTNLLDEWCAQNVLSTFESVLSNLATKFNCPLDSINLISARDEQLINTWNAKVPPPAHQTLNEIFGNVFRNYENKEVVYTSDGCFTYGELDDLSTILAVRFMQMGLKPNIVVPICMDKSRWVTCAMTAVWKAGGAITAMDPTHPNDRLFATVEELDARIVISDATHASRFRKLGIQIVSDLENLPRLLESGGRPISRADSWHMSGVTPSDLAFVAFTSGSSGKPKGVMHTHDRLTSEHLSYGLNLGYSEESRILQFASYAYIPGIGENYRTMLHGATLCVPSEVERTSDLVGFITRSRANRSYMTPSLLRTLNPQDVPGMQHLVVGGEHVDRELERLWTGHVHFVQLYGSSEGGLMIKETWNSNDHGKGFYPVGGLAWLVDPQNVDCLVPVGAVGEIVFESYELSAGYLNDMERTAKTFLNPPIWAHQKDAAKGCRYLRMGDLGRYETDGSISVYGRADTQVKVHGQRVELQDIECNLRALLPLVADVVVELVKPFDAPDRPLLTAFCCFGHGNAGNGEWEPASLNDGPILSNLQSQLEKVLPRHMIPKAFIVVQKLPQNSSNKIDRRQLRTDAGKMDYKTLTAFLHGASGEHFESPENEKERILAETWASILHRKVKNIGRRDNFLALGGDSLAAIRLVSSVRSKGIRLTTQIILRHPILKDMTELAEDLDDDSLSYNISPSKDTITLRATDFQEWAAAVGALNGGWIDHFVYDFSGRLDLDRLEQSCLGLIAAHSILRMIFTFQLGQVYMEIPSEQKIPFQVHQVTIDELDSKSNEIYEKHRISPLGIPIVRFDLIKASSTRHRLILKLSHAQYDGFCARTFGQHLRLLYFSLPLPQTLPFYEYARKIQEPELIHEAETYWQEYLKNSQMPRLVKRIRSGPPFNNTLDGELRRSVREPNLLSRGVTSAALVKTAWAMTISSLSQSMDVVFGDFIAGRQMPIPGVETVVGPCVNFIPLRVRLSNITNLELMQQVQADLISAIPYESLGFKHIIQNCTSWGQDERFSSIINFVNIETASFGREIWHIDDDGNKLEMNSIYKETQFDKTDLWLLCLPGHLASKPGSGIESGGKTMGLYFRYSRKVYHAGAIDKIANIYCQALNTLVTAPDAKVFIPPILGKENSSLVPAAN